MKLAKDHWLFHIPFAHRGLHDKDGAPENTLQAFQLAIDKGYGIELDVQFSRDKKVMVFHDERLEHLTNGDGLTEDQTAHALGKLKVKGTDQSIPTLATVLELVGGKVPVLVEIKGLEGGSDDLDAAVANELDNYRGDFAVLAFNPLRLEWFANNRPNMLRGQNTERYLDGELNIWRRFVYQHCLLNYKSRPNFISYEIDMLPNWRMRRFRKQNMPMISWTINNVSRLKAARKYVDNIIFEKIDPEQVS